MPPGRSVAVCSPAPVCRPDQARTRSGRLPATSGSGAEKAYRETLEREPGSGRAFFGLAAALDGLGKGGDAREARGRAAKAWANADADLPQLQKMRTSTAGQ